MFDEVFHISYENTQRWADTGSHVYCNKLVQYVISNICHSQWQPILFILHSYIITNTNFKYPLLAINFTDWQNLSYIMIEIYIFQSAGSLHYHLTDWHCADIQLPSLKEELVVLITTKISLRSQVIRQWCLIVTCATWEGEEYIIQDYASYTCVFLL